MSLRKRVAEVDTGKNIEAVKFTLQCSNNLQNNKGVMNVGAIILHGKALYDANQVIDKFFILTDRGFLIQTFGVPMYFRLIPVDICDGANLNGFTNLRKAMSQNVSLDPNKFSLPHFHDHDEGVKRINWNPKVKKLFIF